MLRLSTKRLKIYLSPGKLIVVQQSGFIARRVLSHHLHVAENKPLSIEALSGQLNAILQKASYKNTRVDVLLSAHYVRYLVTVCDVRLNAEEQNALTRHSFEAVYGEAVSGWSIFPGWAGFNKNEFACGAESSLLNSLMTVFEQNNLNLLSVTPVLISAINYFRKKILQNAWFVMIEQGQMQLVKFLHGSPVSVRAVSLFAGWEDEMEVVFAREALYMQDNKLPVYFFWPEHPHFTNVLLKENKVNILRMKAIEGFSDKRDSGWAIGLCA